MKLRVTPTFFKSADDFRRWLARHHASAEELWVGYYRKGSGKPSMSWPESVDEALCFGWIDGIRKRVDDASYANRFTPRKRTSTWSAINIKRAQALIEEGRMRPAGRAAFEARRENRSGLYSYEQRPQDLPQPYARLLRKNKTAWEFFQAQPPSYRRVLTWWVISARKEETRLRRLQQLIDHSAHGRRIA